jgi:hypothetical protein
VTAVRAAWGEGLTQLRVTNVALYEGPIPDTASKCLAETLDLNPHVEPYMDRLGSINATIRDCARSTVLGYLCTLAPFEAKDVHSRAD